MKKLFNALFFLSLFFAETLFAQKAIDHIRYEVVYSTGSLIIPHRGIIKEDDCILLIGDSVTSYSSLREGVYLQKQDSLRKKGYDVSQIRSQLSGLKRGLDNSILYKNLPQRGQITFLGRIVKYFYYVEKYELPKWKIENETKTVLGFRCQKATADYCGRTWIVWFAPEIPIGEGPWKLSGLPGLILEAVDAKDEYHFSCTEIRNVEVSTPLTIKSKPGTKTTKQKYFELNKSLYLDPDKTISSIVGVEIKQTSDQKIERSYNPIEL